MVVATAIQRMPPESTNLCLPTSVATTAQDGLSFPLLGDQLRQLGSRQEQSSY